MAPPFTHRVADLELEPAPLDPDTIIEGSPEVSELILATSLDGRVVLSHLGPSEGAGLEQLFFDLTTPEAIA